MFFAVGSVTFGGCALLGLACVLLSRSLAGPRQHSRLLGEDHLGEGHLGEDGPGGGAGGGEGGGGGGPPLNEPGLRRAAASRAGAAVSSEPGRREAIEEVTEVATEPRSELPSRLTEPPSRLLTAVLTQCARPLSLVSAPLAAERNTWSSRTLSLPPLALPLSLPRTQTR